MTRIICFILIAFVLPLARILPQTVLFTEHFEDTNYSARGWYDGAGPVLTDTVHIPGSARCAQFLFRKGATTPTSGGAMRHLFPAGGSVYLSYWVKYSANWEGSNRPYHPHEFSFLTDEDDRYIGPAATHLTTYIEQNEGRPLLAIQDALNIDESRVGQDLTPVTEQRAVAGCNGSSDRYPPGDCYLSGSTHRNGKVWKAPFIAFSDTAGTHDKNDWHFVEAYFQLNSIAGGKGVADGIVRYWFDGTLLIDAPDVMLRTGAHPDMKFNQFLIAPYIGDGSPVEQTMWVDDLTVATERPGSSGIMNDHSSEEFDYVMQAYPHPFGTTATICLPRSAVIAQCLVFDAKGRDVSATFTWSAPPGSGIMTLYSHEFCPDGLYYVYLMMKEAVVIARLVKVR